LKLSNSGFLIICSLAIAISFFSSTIGLIISVVLLLQEVYVERENRK